MKAHVIGTAGSGKTTLARWLSETFGAPPYHLDRVVYDRMTGQRTVEEIAARLTEVRAGEGWVTEGAYRDEWLLGLLDDAEVIVWLDVPFPICAARMISRHVRAEIAGNNAHPGWRKLARFLNYTRATARRQQRETDDLLHGYVTKVARCRSSREILALRRSLAHART